MSQQIKKDKIVVTERIDGLPIRLHFFKRPNPYDKDFYREIRSYSAFNNVLHPKRRINKNISYSCTHEIEFDIWANFKSSLEWLKDIERINHDNLQAFYAFIGYNRKTKKYS